MQKTNFFSINIQNRVFGLDILRFASIFFVIYAHAFPLLEGTIDAKLYGSISPVNDAVSIFFVLSGFLIGRILLKIFVEKEVSSKIVINFWVRRWFRTLPAYFCTIAILLIISSLNGIFPESFSWKYLVFLQNFKTTIPAFFVESWSLTIEEWFYLLFPIVLFMVLKSSILDRKSTFLFVIGLFIILPIFYKLRRSLMLNSLNPSDLPLFTQQVLTRIDSIVYGVLGAYIKYFYPVFWKKIKFGALAAMFGVYFGLRLTSFHPFGLYAQVFSAAVESILILLSFPFFDAIKFGKGFVFKVITWISIISYSLYLLNLSVVFNFVIPALKANVNFLKYSPIGTYITYFTVTVFLAYLLHIFCEKPMMQLRDKLSDKDN